MNRLDLWFRCILQLMFQLWKLFELVWGTYVWLFISSLQHYKAQLWEYKMDAGWMYKKKNAAKVLCCSAPDVTDYCADIQLWFGWKWVMVDGQNICWFHPSGYSALRNSGWITLLVAKVTANKHTDNWQLHNEHLRARAAHDLSGWQQRPVSWLTDTDSFVLK